MHEQLASAVDPIQRHITVKVPHLPISRVFAQNHPSQARSEGRLRACNISPEECEAFDGEARLQNAVGFLLEIRHAVHCVLKKLTETNIWFAAAHLSKKQRLPSTDADEALSLCKVPSAQANRPCWR